MLNLTKILSIVFSSALTINAQRNCSLDLSNTNVLLLDEFKIILPDPNKTSIELDYDAEFRISCPEGSTSPLLADRSEVVRCRGGTELYLSRTEKSILFTDIKCVQNLPATADITDYRCQNVGRNVDLEFIIHYSGEFKTTTLYTVCFDQKNLVPLNVTYNVTFDQWGAFSNEIMEHYFVDDAHLYEDIDLDNLYSNQELIFDRLELSEYHTEEVYLIKGHLLPSYILKYSLFSYASFNYANVVPQWSTFRNVFAEFVNGFITEHSMKPKSYEAGTFRVATLNNSENELVELYLDDAESRVPVPRWIWFTFEGSFTIYGYNNPYYEESEVEAEFKEMCVLPFSFEKFKDMLVGVCAGVPIL